jgi:hypothetical protein
LSLSFFARADDAGDAVKGGCDEDDGDVDDEH